MIYLKCNFCGGVFPAHLIYAVGSDAHRAGVYNFCSQKCACCFWQMGPEVQLEFDPRIFGETDPHQEEGE